MYVPGGISGTPPWIAYARSPRLEAQPQRLRREGHGNKVVLSLATAGFDQQSVVDAGHQRIRSGALHPGPHSGDTHTVCEVRDGDGIGRGNKIPDGVRVLVGLDLTDGDDFKRRELELSVEGKENGVGVRRGRTPVSAEKPSPRRM